MTFLETLAARNADYAAHDFNVDLQMLPSARTIILGCVDPMDILKLEAGEVVIVRNIGGRINPALFETLAILRAVAGGAGQELGAGWNLVVMHHTNCGIVGCHHLAPGLLAQHMGVSVEALDDLAIIDPYAAVAKDIDALRANPAVPSGFTVTGLVYDTATGRIETVVPASLLRAS